MRYERLPYERIRNLRIDNNLTQEYIAKKLKYKAKHLLPIRNWHTGYPVEVLIKLAEFYNTSIDYLLELTDNPAPYERKSK